MWTGPQRCIPVATSSSAAVLRVLPREFVAGESARVTNRSYGLSSLNALDDVVAVAPGVRPVGVDLVAVRLGEPHHVEPVLSPTARRSAGREQPLDELLVGVGSLVLQERIDFLRRRRKAGQVERDAADERELVGFRPTA